MISWWWIEADHYVLIVVLVNNFSIFVDISAVTDFTWSVENCSDYKNKWNKLKSTKNSLAEPGICLIYQKWCMHKNIYSKTYAKYHIKVFISVWT